ncbi:MAG TPA: Ger(x)C family spore germination protein [Symbiobacteriaceae bacterium]|nr:Ger(x)C family spore germination protein [Symbiobacteriaceae bacterium]
MQRRRRVTTLLLPLVLLLAGCWDRREIDERSNVLATGADLCEKGQGCNLIVTRQIAIPGRIPLGGATGAPAKGESVVAFSTPGKNGPDTARKAQAELNRTVSFAHTRFIAFSEAFARQGLREYLDYVRRVPEVRRLMWITITEGKASDVLRSKPSLELVPALYVNDMIDDAVKAGRLPDIYLGEFLTRISNKGEDTVAPIIRMIGLDHPALAGLAVFRDFKMVGKLTPDEMFTQMQLRGHRKGAESFEVALPGGNSANIRVYERTARYRLSQNQGRLTCRIQVRLETEVLQLSPELSGEDPKVLADIERRGAEEVVKRANALMKKLQQEYQADILGVGEHVRGTMPKYWKTVSEDWSKAFAKTQFQVEAEVHIRRTGLGTE